MCIKGGPLAAACGVGGSYVGTNFFDRIFRPTEEQRDRNEVLRRMFIEGQFFRDLRDTREWLRDHPDYLGW